MRTVLCERGREEQFFSGVCEGVIGTSPRGENGFGYDPVFCVGEQTMAEMTDAEKNQISHRGKALEQLEDFFKTHKND